jgi:hypothetical protein
LAAAATCQASNASLAAPRFDSSLNIKNDSGDKIMKTSNDATGSANISQNPSNAPKSKVPSTFIDVSPISRRETPRINPKTNDDDRTNVHSCFI